MTIRWPMRTTSRVARSMTYEEIEHELKTPLTSIRSLSEIVRDHPDLSDEERRRFLDAIVQRERAADR